jgi:hypothetical protein
MVETSRLTLQGYGIRCAEPRKRFDGNASIFPAFTDSRIEIRR